MHSRRELTKVADIIQNQKLSLYERYTFCISPVSFKTSKLLAYSKRVPSLENLDTYCIDKFFQWISEYSTYGEVRVGIELGEITSAIKGLDQQDTLGILQDFYGSTLAITSSGRLPLLVIQV